MTAVWAVADADEPAGLAPWAAARLVEAGVHADGLYVATATAGGREAVTFFREGLATGLAFASPRLFPWTLANSVTGAIALALGIRGPTYTLVGGSSALEAAFEHAADDLAGGLVSTALVVGVDAGPEGLRLAAVTTADGVPPPLAPGQRPAAALGAPLRP